MGLPKRAREMEEGQAGALTGDDDPGAGDARSVMPPRATGASSPLVPPSANRLVRGLYPLPDEPRAGRAGPVSPFRLPRMIEASLWEPRRYLPVLPGTVSIGTRTR